MKPKTLIECIDQLKPAHQEFITRLMKAYRRPDFHRGLLPFLRVDETILLIDGFSKRDGKFRAQLLNVLHKHLNYRLYPDEVSVVMYLKDVMLAKHYYQDFKSGFCIWVPEKIDWATDKNYSRVYLSQISKNNWKVTAHPKSMERVTTFLAERMR